MFPNAISRAVSHLLTSPMTYWHWTFRKVGRVITNLRAVVSRWGAISTSISTNFMRDLLMSLVKQRVMTYSKNLSISMLLQAFERLATKICETQVITFTYTCKACLFRDPGG